MIKKIMIEKSRNKNKIEVWEYNKKGFYNEKQGEYFSVAWKYCSIVISNILLILCSYFNISESLEICCVGLWIINIYGVIPAKTRKEIKTLSEDSFGIYLFHSPLIYFTFTFMPNVSPIVVVLVNFFVFGGLAILITEAVRKIGLLFIIGEKGNRKIPIKYKNGGDLKV